MLTVEERSELGRGERLDEAVGVDEAVEQLRSEAVRQLVAGNCDRASGLKFGELVGQAPAVGAVVVGASAPDRGEVLSGVT